MRKLEIGVLVGCLGLLAIGCGGSSGEETNRSVIGLWCTTSTPTRNAWTQVDRLARPVVNEVFATVADDRHQINDRISPVNDKDELANDIQGFMTFPAGRAQATTDVVKAILVPDMMKVDLSKFTGEGYLGFETAGGFGGRLLTDDVVDVSLGVVFGTTISALGLAPNDGNEIPSLTSDNVGPGGKHFTSTFPYLGSAQ